MHSSQFCIPPGKKIKLKDYHPGATPGYKHKDEAAKKLANDIEKMAELQDILYACRQHALLIIFQAMDTAGKDGAIKHVMSGVNPQGVQVTSFKAPTEQEQMHDFLWRCHKSVPERGYIGIFNRSYYEEVLVTRVHPEILEREGVSAVRQAMWKARYEDINNFERLLSANGVVILKFALNLSKDEQRNRLLERIDHKDKNWKFSINDLKERLHWDEYQQAYETMFNHTSTEWAPWYCVPADHKWYTRAVVADVIVSTLAKMGLKYPALTSEQKKLLAEGKQLLLGEKHAPKKRPVIA